MVCEALLGIIPRKISSLLQIGSRERFCVGGTPWDAPGYLPELESTGDHVQDSLNSPLFWTLTRKETRLYWKDRTRNLLVKSVPILSNVEHKSLGKLALTLCNYSPAQPTPTCLFSRSGNPGSTYLAEVVSCSTSVMRAAHHPRTVFDFCLKHNTMISSWLLSLRFRRACCERLCWIAQPSKISCDALLGQGITR
ncbi:unnamed protein product, partial [Nesidiocoris tenuis]